MASLADNKGARLVARPDVVSQRRPGQGRRSLLGRTFPPSRRAHGFRPAGAAGLRHVQAGRLCPICPWGFLCLRYMQIVTI